MCRTRVEVYLHNIIYQTLFYILTIVNYFESCRISIIFRFSRPPGAWMGDVDLNMIFRFINIFYVVANKIFKFFTVTFKYCLV